MNLANKHNQYNLTFDIPYILLKTTPPDLIQKQNCHIPKLQHIRPPSDQSINCIIVFYDDLKLILNTLIFIL